MRYRDVYGKEVDDMTNGLEKCPFCGRETAKLQERFNFLTGAKKLYYIQCSSCGALTRECETNFEAFEIWNTRRKAK